VNSWEVLNRNYCSGMVSPGAPKSRRGALPVVAYLSAVPDLIGAEHLESLQYSSQVACAGYQ